MLREGSPWLCPVEFKCKFCLNYQKKKKIKRFYLGLIVSIREGKVGWAPLSVSSRFLVLGTLVALHHGRESLSSVASELQLDPGREHSHPEQEDAFMKELFIGKS